MRKIIWSNSTIIISNCLQDVDFLKQVQRFLKKILHLIFKFAIILTKIFYRRLFSCACFQKTQNITNLQQYKAEKERKKLTPRELEVLRCIVDGLSNQEIAEKLFVSVHTSKAHVCNIFKKLVVEDRVLAAVIAIREHLI